MSPLNEKIEYPYIHPKGVIVYEPGDNPFMAKAKNMAKKFRSNLHHPAAALVVKNGKIIGEGSIGNNPYHLRECVRVSLNMPTGQGYDLCKGCAVKYHSEAAAVTDAKNKNHDTVGAEVYLWGHWWCCKDCWHAMTAAGIFKVHLLEGSEVLFNKEADSNIVGKQFSS